MVGGTLYKFNGQGRILGQGFAPSRGASNAFVSRGAKIGTYSNAEINAGKENGKATAKEGVLKSSGDKTNVRKVRIVKRAKKIDPKEERHKYDSRIDIIKKWKDAYDLNVSKIEDAYIRASIAGIESALVEQETLRKSRKQEIDDAKSRLSSIGGDASKYVVKEDKNYKLVLLRIEKEIRKIEEFNAFYAQNKAAIELALEDGRLWGARNDYMEDLEQYVKDKNSFGIKE